MNSHLFQEAGSQLSTPIEALPGIWIYHFGEGKADGNAGMRDVLGGKGANLAEMANLGLPVPPGFTIKTEACGAFYDNNGKLPNGLYPHISQGLAELQRKTGKTFGDNENPLLVSVRSGAPVSMPGMMVTVANVGLNDISVETLVKQTGSVWFAYDSYRRLMEKYAAALMDIPPDDFEKIVQKLCEENGHEKSTEFTADDWKEVIGRYKEFFTDELGIEFPQDPHVQMHDAITTVFQSWSRPGAVMQRIAKNISDSMGTAINVQAMVFGNLDDQSATGVAFTRVLNTGEKRLSGDFIPRAQGEDIVGGRGEPQFITNSGREKYNSPLPTMEETLPDAFKLLKECCELLEKHYRDVQEIEFTVEKGRLWILQTRNAEYPEASFEIAMDMVNEGLITKEQALERVDLNTLPISIDPNAERNVIAKGTPACGGAAYGEVALTVKRALDRAAQGANVILCRVMTEPEDVRGIDAAKGVLTTQGGRTSHATRTAVGMSKPCIVGAGSAGVATPLKIDLANSLMRVGETIIREGDTITIDGYNGDIMLGKMPIGQFVIPEAYHQLIKWRSELASNGRVNAIEFPPPRVVGGPQDGPA
jgi:pyruvate,orthophosphate dikinase